MVTNNSKSDLPLAIFLHHMHLKLEINMTKVKGGCQSGRKVVTHNPKNDLPLDALIRIQNNLLPLHKIIVINTKYFYVLM